MLAVRTFQERFAAASFEIWFARHRPQGGVRAQDGVTPLVLADYSHRGAMAVSRT